MDLLCVDKRRSVDCLDTELEFLKNSQRTASAISFITVIFPLYQTPKREETCTSHNALLPYKAKEKKGMPQLPAHIAFKNEI